MAGQDKSAKDRILCMPSCRHSARACRQFRYIIFSHLDIQFNRNFKFGEERAGCIAGIYAESVLPHCTKRMRRVTVHLQAAIVRLHQALVGIMDIMAIPICQPIFRTCCSSFLQAARYVDNWKQR